MQIQLVKSALSGAVGQKGNCRNVWEYGKRHNGCEHIVKDSCVCLLFGCLLMPFHTLSH